LTTIEDVSELPRSDVAVQLLTGSPRGRGNCSLRPTTSRNYGEQAIAALSKRVTQPRIMYDANANSCGVHFR
jgi:hypothetical protein